MIEQVYWLNSCYWPILNLHAIFVRNFPELDIFYVQLHLTSQNILACSKSYKLVVFLESKTFFIMPLVPSAIGTECAKIVKPTY
jgi:hypothetical protein